MCQKEQTLHSIDLTQPRNKLRIESSYMKIYKQYSFGFGLVLLVMMFLGCGGQKEIKPEKDEAKTGHIISTNVEADQKKTSDSIPIEIVVQFGEEENEMRYPAKLRFLSSEIIDVRDVDPYKDLPFPSIGEYENGIERYYDLSELSLEKQNEILAGSRINKDALRNTNYLRLVTNAPIVQIAGDKTVIAYQAYFFCNEEDILATQGYALIYDANGNILHKIHDKKDGFYDIHLSSDGKYLMQKYGTNYGEDGSGWLDQGFKFYDTDSGEMTFEWELGKDQFLSGFDFLRYAKSCTNFYREEGSEFDYFVIDILNGIVYKKTFNRKLLNDPGYVIFPSFIKSKKISDLLNDGFIKVN